MPELTSEESELLGSLSELIYCNPFQPERIELERGVLRDAYEPESLDAWSRTEESDRHDRANIVRINRRAHDLAEQLLAKQAAGSPLQGAHAVLYDDLVTYTLYYRFFAVLDANLLFPQGEEPRLKRTWSDFQAERARLLAPLAAKDRRALADDAHLFACLHQVRRAFHGIFYGIIGQSAPATRLRAQVWQSIFTHDLRRYRRALYAQMSQLATLVTGPSGSGKELVAQAIGRAQYRAFDANKGCFTGDRDAMAAINLSAMSPTLIESELFGHRKGAFTGATADRIGWLERCTAHGAVLLDEIGELDPAIQVKLLRVLQSRDFSRLGETRSRRFEGKLIAATNRELAAEVRAGRFREDLYYRLCSDRVVTPSLRDQLAGRPEAIEGLVRFFSRRVLGGGGMDEREVESLAHEALDWVRSNLPSHYPWPGNIRELEQCVRSVLVRREYHPLAPQDPDNAAPAWLKQAERGELTADQLLTAYCRHVYAQEQGYVPTAQKLGVDRRTVKSRVTKA